MPNDRPQGRQAPSNGPPHQRAQGLRLERALAACSGQLLAERAVPVARALRALVQGGDLARAALYLNEEDPHGCLCLRLAAQAAAAGRAPLGPGGGRGYLELGLGRWAQKLFQGTALCGPSRDFPEAERAWLESAGPCSCAILPLRRHGRWAGFLRVEAPDPEHAWSRESLSLLKVAAGLFGTRLEREYSGDALGGPGGGVGGANGSALAPGLGDPALLGILDGMPVLVAALDSQGRVAFWNRECQRVTGYAAHEVVGDRDMARRIFPDLAPARSRAKAKPGQPGQSAGAASQSLGHRDVRLACKDGGVRTIAWSDLSRTLPLPGLSQRWKDWRMGVDISERSRVEQAIVQAKQEWERTFDSVPDCILILDEVLHARRMNMTLADRLGMHPREIVGKTLSEVVGTEGDAALRILALASCSACTSEELSIPRWGGHFLVTASPYVDARDEHAGTIVVAHDVSRWKELEDQLEQSRKLEALGTLAGGIAHDFNNILGVMMGYAEMVLLSVQGSGPQEHRVQEILRAGTRAKELIAQILAFSRQGEGRLIPLTLGPLVKEVLQHLMVTMPHGVQVRRNLARETGTVMGDPSLLHQVVLNLCTNAVQALGEGGGTLEVGLDELVLGEGRPAELAELPPGPCVRLTVRDTGPGIPPEILGRIFDPFFTTKRPGEGTGMGLAVVHGIMRRLGGGIVVESRPGGGTAMSVYLPRAEAPGEAGAENGRTAPAGRGHVLLVDDEAALLEVWAETLGGLGYRVTKARTAEEALAAFMEGPESFDVLLTDQVMPRISGTELAGLILGLKPDLPVVLCTGNSGGAVLEAARRLGVAEVLDKPVSRLRMAEALGRVLSQNNGGRQPR